MFKIGDRVEILDRNISSLRHRKGKWFGRISHINGEYIDVRPMWCKWITECYPCELRRA